MSDARTDRCPETGPGTAAFPWLISGFGGISVAFFVVWIGWFASALDPTAVLLGFGTVAVPSLGLVWAGYRLDRSGIDPARYGRIVQWCFGGGLGFLLVNVVVIAVYPWSLSGNLIWGHFSLITGAVAGFAVGYVEARAIQREVEATAAAVRARRLEEEREVLSYLNDLLRHEVLNSAQIIGGHASLLLEDAEGRRRDSLETIDRESDALTDVIGDVRAMLNATRNPEVSAVVDLGEILREELTALQRRFDDAEVDATIPETLLVEGNDGIKWIFSNVLENAIEHNDSDRPRVEVTVETTPDCVAVAIADNGPGIPADTREDLFERKSENHGLGLYFVRILANRYGGGVELTETGPDGSVFTVTLPRATDDPTDETPDGNRVPDDPADLDVAGFESRTDRTVDEGDPAGTEPNADTGAGEGNDPATGTS